MRNRVIRENYPDKMRNLHVLTGSFSGANKRKLIPRNSRHASGRTRISHFFAFLFGRFWWVKRLMWEWKEHVLFHQTTFFDRHFSSPLQLVRLIGKLLLSLQCVFVCWYSCGRSAFFIVFPFSPPVSLPVLIQPQTFCCGPLFTKKLCNCCCELREAGGD
jgi:hypothetical protein